MARYSRELLAPVLERLEVQAITIGRLENEVNHLRARVAELEAPAPPTSSTNGAVPDAQAHAQAEAPATTEPSETQNGAAPHEGERRRWWQRVGAWLNGPQVST